MEGAEYPKMGGGVVNFFLYALGMDMHWKKIQIFTITPPFNSSEKFIVLQSPYKIFLVVIFKFCRKFIVGKESIHARKR